MHTAASVLTVEDNPITRTELRLVLEDAGFEVVADARDGAEAVELAREHRPDLILLDLGLPVLDGIQAARQILAERSVPIVAVTGRSTRLVEQALGAGAASYLLKPFATEQLVEAVNDALAVHRTRTERLAPHRVAALAREPRAARRLPARVGRRARAAGVGSRSRLARSREAEPAGRVTAAPCLSGSRCELQASCPSARVPASRRRRRR